MKDDAEDNAGVIAFPPLIGFGPLVVGLLLNWAFPLGFSPNGLQLRVSLPVIFIGVSPWILTVSLLQLVFSLSIIVLGILLMMWAGRTLRLNGTTVAVSKPTRVIVDGGPYRFSRNPIYLSGALIYVGIAVFFNALWAMLLLPVAFLGLQFGVIAREERYLKRKFGEEYLRYKRKVRQWL